MRSVVLTRLPLLVRYGQEISLEKDFAGFGVLHTDSR
jgi:hypothetical protein